MRGAILGAAAAVLLLIAIWVRTPTLPRTAEGGLPTAGERVNAAEAALRALGRALEDTRQRLEQRAKIALDAPVDQRAAFEFLASRSPVRDGESVILYDSSRPLAWAGTTRVNPDSVIAPVSVTFSPFYTTLDVVVARGNRRALATSVLEAFAPADRLTTTLEEQLATEQGVTGYDFSPPSDVGGGPVVMTANSVPILRAVPQLATAEELRFRGAATFRARGTIALVILTLAFLFFAWRSRRLLGIRLFAIAVAIAVTALVPWNSFSSTARIFDPAFYFSRLAGPLTANAAALSISASLILLAVYAVIRALPNPRWPRLYGAIGAIVVLGIGLPLASNIVRGIGQPPWGTTPGLWLSWEVPLFIFLFAALLLAFWLLRIALRKEERMSFTSVVIVGIVAAVVSLTALASTTSRQRMQLGEQDVAALGHVDDYAVQLTRRLVNSVAGSPRSVNSADLLKVYASSDLAAAEYPATLASWDRSGRQIAELAIVPAQTDSQAVATAVREALTTGQTVLRSILGPTGVQVLAAVRDSSGGATSILVLPRTRLLASNPYAALLGMAPPSGGDPPYSVVLTDVSPAVVADTARVQWHRTGDELHGDRLISTSTGTMRAHLEIDLRSIWARAERGVLVLLLNLLVAGFFWLLAAVTEKGFGRWLRVRAARWIYTYHARLTLALFAFFVIPAIAFAVWSYERLRGDDLQTREVLVQETLRAVESGNEYRQLAGAARRFETPLFLYSNSMLIGSSDSLLDALSPIGRPLPPPVHLRLGTSGEVDAAWEAKLGAARMLFGFTTVPGPVTDHFVLAAPARSDDLVLDRRRRDLGILVLFATAAGAIAALWLSGIAARRLARDLELSRIEVARAERVLAWGEMARQIAHEIKNPLTPIRLGVQHLRRARTDPRVDYDVVLNDNVRRILAEIDRLDEIARSFSRYGSAPADLPPAESVDVAAIVKDVVGLEQMGDRKIKWQLRGADRAQWAMARKDEMRDVLLNVFENARLAGARRVEITVREEERRVTIATEDNGSGIPAAVMPRIFEPHFSTRTTGSGLGLAVTRRLIEAWGGEIGITSEEGVGTRVMIVLARSVA
ncbi:MAG TPA: ATP-binding protein [Gemmatimonadaceae bacterium]|nr:ATP-binding protein [Gemmatimonadaceae bacterium]